MTISDYENKLNYTHQNLDHVTIPYPIAKEIIINYKDYPKIMGSLAEKACRLYANANLTPVGKIAENETWFD